MRTGVVQVKLREFAGLLQRLVTGWTGFAPPWGNTTSGQENIVPLKRHVIERDIAGLGGLSDDELSAAAGTSNHALAQLTPQV